MSIIELFLRFNSNQEIEITNNSDKWYTGKCGDIPFQKLAPLLQERIAGIFPEDDVIKIVTISKEGNQ